MNSSTDKEHEMTTETTANGDDIVGTSPIYGGIPHCGIYDCMDYEGDCRICHRSISTGATICDRHPLPSIGRYARTPDGLRACYCGAVLGTCGHPMRRLG